MYRIADAYIRSHFYRFVWFAQTFSEELSISVLNELSGVQFMHERQVTSLSMDSWIVLKVNSGDEHSPAPQNGEMVVTEC